VFRALFSDAPRDRNGPTSVIGLGQAVNDLGAAGQWRYILDLLAFMTVFIGLVNLVPLPPFDGGHLALLVIEKIRGRAVDFRNVIPVAVTVIVLLSAFVLATALLDITKPILQGP
jgi:membrane-associated protease RseP (regulator of RpoE activity)